MTSPKRFDASALLGAPRDQGRDDQGAKAPWRRYERISAYVRTEQRDWLEEIASHGLRNASVSDVLRVAVDVLQERVGEGFDLASAIIRTAERDVADGYQGKGKIGVPRRR